jgi:CubicO group peptidase (beta-lactamase class C family)
LNSRSFIATFILSLAGGLVAGHAGAQESAASTNSAWDALYMERLNSMQDRTSKNGLSAYDPLKTVPGAPSWEPLPTRAKDKRLVSVAALRDSVAYAEANNSSALMVWVDGALETEQYFGDASADSLVIGKSLSKPLSVIALGRAIDKGFIDSLDQPVADFIEPWRDTPKSVITLRQLVGNRSGLLPQGWAPAADNVLNRAYLHPAHDQVIIHEYPLVDEPGSRYEYSNANSELVSIIIESATDTPYEDWISSEVLAPLGAKGGEIWMNRPDGVAHSGCCVLLPAETFLRLGLLILQDGVWEGKRLLPSGYVDQMRTTTPENPHAGLGLYVGYPYNERRGAAHPDMTIGRTLHSEPYAADDLILFDGNSNQVVYIIPSQSTVILRTGAWPPAEPEWDNARLPNLILRSLQQD